MWFIENPWPGVTIFGGLAAIFLILGLRRGLGRDWLLAGICLLGVGGVFVIDELIVTPAEEIDAEVQQLLRECKNGDVERVLAYVSNRALVLKAGIAAGLALTDIHDDVRLSDLRTEMNADNSQGVSHFRANGTVSVGGVGYSGHVATRWKVTWEKEGEHWRIIQVQRLNPINGQPMELLERSQT